MSVLDILLPYLVYVLPFILVPVICVVLWIVWKRFVQMKNIFHGKPWVLLEVILPKEIFKSPQSMEIIFGAFAQGYSGTWWTRLVEGSLRTWFTLEMVSIEGRMHFYIRTLKLFKHLIESQIYAQYGDIEVREAEDYVHLIKSSESEGWSFYGAQLKLAMPDPYPIKTYVDYGLDNMSLKEEMKTDPLTPTIEYLGSLGAGEYAGIQILVQAAKDRVPVPGFWKKKKGWKDEGADLVKKLMDKKGETTKKDKDGAIKIELGQLKLSPGEQDVVKAIERSISKIGFDCGIRMIYAAPKDKYQLSHQLSLINLFAQYATLNLNGFKSDLSTSDDAVIQGWLGITKKKMRWLKYMMLDAYRTRSYFYPPYKFKPFVLNTEELATIFHFPGGVITSGGLPRIESKKSEAPANLPTGQVGLPV
ncbi:MAG: hypothetical protein AAB590_03745 [Patescibacteria group bacterium]